MKEKVREKVNPELNGLIMCSKADFLVYNIPSGFHTAILVRLK